VTSNDRTALEVFPQHGEPPFSEYHYVNFERELRAAKAIARWTSSEHLRTSLIAFGYPGNGKRAFAQSVSKALFAEGYGTAWIEIGALLTLSEADLRSQIERVRGLLGTSSAQPQLVVLNGLDSLTNQVFEEPALLEMHKLTSSLVSTSASARTILMGTASFPAIALSALHPSSPWLFYFDWPDPALAGNLLSHIGIPEPSSIAKAVYDRADDAGYRLTVSSWVTGGRQVARALESSAASQQIDIADMIFKLCSPTTITKLDQYRNGEVRDHRKRAETDFEAAEKLAVDHNVD
jgi:hypothetical protein